MATYLHEILAAHRAAARLDQRPLEALVEEAAHAGSPRGLRRALCAGPGLSVIAEIKRRLPSKGDLAPDLDAAAVAADYAGGGAAALSVLTDHQFFSGSPADLQAARAASGLAVLRKDFTVDPRQVADARLMGADAVLLIVVALSDDELSSFSALARSLDLDVVVEVHDEGEARRVLSVLTVDDIVLGVNQRDLTTFEVDPRRAQRVAAVLPGDAVTVAESGISGKDGLAGLLDAGFQGVLVGESLVTASDRRAAVAELCRAGRKVKSGSGGR